MDRSNQETRREALRHALPAAVDLLQRRCAGEINGADIEAFVDLDWLEWHGGGLRVTTTGRNICRQMQAERLVRA